MMLLTHSSSIHLIWKTRAELVNLNVKELVNLNVTELVKLNVAELVNLNVTELLNLNVTKLVNLNVMALVNLNVTVTCGLFFTTEQTKTHIKYTDDTICSSPLEYKCGWFTAIGRLHNISHLRLPSQISSIRSHPTSSTAQVRTH